MAIRGIGDGYAFQRLLWLLVGLVIAPTILLALYGASAIRNQNAWIGQQIRQQQELRLQDAARELYRRIGGLDGSVRAQAARCTRSADVSCAVDDPAVRVVWAWPGDQEPPESLGSVGLPDPEGTATLWYRPVDGSDPIGVFEVGTHHVAWQLDVERLGTEVGDLAARGADEGLKIALEGSTSPGPAMSADALAPRAPDEAELLLDRPLSAWRLVARYPEGSKVADLYRRTAWISPAALVLLVALVLLGAVLTLGSASREIRLSRLQTDFVSSVSHELRTPLTSIRMFVETLQSGRLKDPEKVEECLHLLGQETDRLSRMIERVLGWARMEAGRRIYELEDVAADELVDHALTALRTQRLLSDEVEIEVRIPSDLPALHVDRDAIVEALLNLLQNAVKYTPAPRQIAVAAQAKGAEVGLAVEDNGPGIAKSDRKRIFEKFYQADTLLSSATQKGADRGSGLGLSIVRAVVRGHGGRVELDSELGQGSRFILWLPAASAR